MKKLKYLVMCTVIKDTVNRFNSTELKFHDFPESTNRDGFNFALQENL
jgi:hypothetical protein